MNEQYLSPDQGLNFRIGRQRPFAARTSRYFDLDSAQVTGPKEIYRSAIDKDLPKRSIYPLGIVIPPHSALAFRLDFRICFDFNGQCVFELPMGNALPGTMVAGEFSASLDYTQIVGQVWVASGSANQPQLRITHSSGYGASTACFAVKVTADTIRYVVDYQIGGPSYLRGFLLISEDAD